LHSRIFSSSVALVALLFPVAAVGAAEIQSLAQISVKDALNHPIAGVSILLETATGKVVTSGLSDTQGIATLSAPNGIYLAFAQAAGFNPGTVVVNLKGGHVSAGITLASQEALTIQVTARRRQPPRNTVNTQLGVQSYKMDQQAIKELPRGEDTPVNQVLLQAPGVVQDTFSQIHIRGDHGNVQYRINGIMLPQGVGGVGSSFDTRFAESVNLLDGTLPAQYGLYTAGVVDLTTKSGDIRTGGTTNLQLGTDADFEPSVQYGGTSGGLDYYISGAYVNNLLGTEPFTFTTPTLHNETWQGNGFGYASKLINANTRASIILGTSQQVYQVPNISEQSPSFTLAGAPVVASENLNEYLRPNSQYAIAALQGTVLNGLAYQLAAFGRYSSLQYQPDLVGDLLYSGVAAAIFRDSLSGGLQGDGSYKLGDHTFRFGVYANTENANSDNISMVFPADANGNQTSTVPETITDNGSLQNYLTSLYAQDAWQLFKPLTLNYGLRYDNEQGFIQTDQLSPRANLVYNLNKETAVHVGYARYFTPPATEEISGTSIGKFLNTTNAIASGGNTQVLPERANYYDAGVTRQLAENLSVGLDAYFENVEDLQDEGQFGKALVYSIFNYAQGQRAGLELSGNYHLGPLSTYANLTVGEAMGKGLTSGQYNFDPTTLTYINNNWIHLDHDQILTASGGANLPIFGTNVGADFVLGSGLRRGFANTENVPPYFQLNLDANRTFDLASFGRFEGRLSLLNALDSRYQLRDGSGIGVGAPQYAYPRTLYAGVSRNF
jgi:outer membrane receptor protein involved in Fe transport